MAESTHRVEIIPVYLEKHPDADTLSIVKFEGYQVVVRTDDWGALWTNPHGETIAVTYGMHDGEEHCPHRYDGCQCGNIGAYIPPDSLVPLDRPEFAFLRDPKKPQETHARIKARKLRGVRSMGLLIPAPPGFAIGDDAAEHLGVLHYEPVEGDRFSTGGEQERPPKAYVPVYDVEAFRRYGRRAFTPDEPVWITEKIHGANGRWSYIDGQMYAGSRNTWKRYDPENLWWRALEQYPPIQEYCTKNPGQVLYGEVYGQVQNLKYGTGKNEVRIALFDIFRNGEWVDALEAFTIGAQNALPWVPVICHEQRYKFDPTSWKYHTFNFENLLEMAEGKSLIPGADHIREGIVVKTLRERRGPKGERINLKIVGQGYWEKS